MFNISTKGMATGQTYVIYSITPNEGSQFGREMRAVQPSAIHPRMTALSFISELGETFAPLGNVVVRFSPTLVWVERAIEESEKLSQVKP